MKNKYHYGFELRTDNLCYGSLSKGLFKTYAEARDYMKILQSIYGTMKIYKVRIYNMEDLWQ